MLAMVAAAVALGILFSSRTFPISPKLRLVLSFVATTTIGFFSEFRNEGKFYFKNLVHFFGPETWIHAVLSQRVSSLGDFLYRMEYSHWNDFLMGPAIVSVLFSLVAIKIYNSFRSQGSISLSASTPIASDELENTLTFARIFMNVGLFWFFTQAWAEKAGYLTNPHSRDEIDLPFEFAGTVLGFWMARVLTRPFDQRLEKFRSTFFVDFVSAGTVGLLYTLIVGPLTEGVARSVARSVRPTIPVSLEVHEYTSLQQHVRPFELLFLAAAMWWALNCSSRRALTTQLSDTYEEPVAQSKWDRLLILALPVAAISVYLLIVTTMLWAADPQGLDWTLLTMGAGVAVTTGALFFVKRVNQQGFTIVFGSKDNAPVD